MSFFLRNNIASFLSDRFAAMKRGRYERRYGFPFFEKILIELQSDCNRRCSFCPRQGDDSGKRMAPDGSKVLRSMPTQTVLGIMNEAAAMGFRGGVNFHHLSEPFLDDRVIAMAVEAAARRMRPYVNTNGDRLRRDEGLCRRAAGIFERINIGLYDCVTEKDIEEEKGFWQERLKGTNVTFSRAAQAPRARIFSDSDKTRFFPRGACVRTLPRLIVHYDGNVALCCEDMKDEFDLGNVFDMSIEQIWFSQRHMRIVRELLKGRRMRYPLCARCPERPHKPAEQVRRAARVRMPR